jgi:hypothetical protein
VLVNAQGGFSIEQDRQPLGVREGRRLRRSFGVAERFGHAVKAEARELVECWMGEHICPHW